MSIRWVLGVLGLTAALLFGRTSLAHADDLGVSFELEAGARLAIADSARFSEQLSPLRISMAGGVYATEHFRLGVEGHFDVADDGRHHELLGTATYFLDLRRVELFAGLHGGRYWRDVDGAGYSDEGFVVGAHAGARIELFGPLSASLTIGHTLSESRYENPVWTHATQLGAGLAVKL